MDKRDNRQQPPMSLRRNERGGSGYPHPINGSSQRPQFCDYCGKPGEIIVSLRRIPICRACLEALKDAAEANS